MNLWNTITSWLGKKTEDDCCVTPIVSTPVAVEETTETDIVKTDAATTSTVKCSCGDVFVKICLSAGVKKRELDKINAEDLFDNWYTGQCDEESVLSAISDFKAEHLTINAKLSGKL